MKVRIIDTSQHRGPVEIKINNSSVRPSQLPTKELTDRPGASASEVSGVPGFISLGQAAFRSLAMANRARKQKE